MATAEQVLSYWFGDANDDEESAIEGRAKMWFSGAPEVDQAIRDQFGEEIERACRGELSEWAQTPRGRLALIILLDQFSRNVYRGTPEAFAQDKMAYKLAASGLDGGMDAKLSTFEQMFFALPLAHAENLAAQERNVEYVQQWAQRVPPAHRKLAQVAIEQAQKHRDVVARFGRFPTRNHALGRTCTADELAYLEELRRDKRAL